MSKLKVPVSSRDHQSGDPAARIVIVEYGDYQCPHCGIAHPFVKKLLKKFDRDLRFIFRNFPLQEIHPVAMPAAQAAEAAGKRSKFWEMHDAIFDHQDELSHDLLFRFAKDFRLDLPQFLKDFKSKEVFEKVEQDFDSGIKSGVNGTPTFFLNGERINDYDESYESLEKAIMMNLIYSER